MCKGTLNLSCYIGTFLSFYPIVELTDGSRVQKITLHTYTATLTAPERRQDGDVMCCNADIS